MKKEEEEEERQIVKKELPEITAPTDPLAWSRRRTLQQHPELCGYAAYYQDWPP